MLTSTSSCVALSLLFAAADPPPAKPVEPASAAAPAAPAAAPAAAPESTPLMRITGFSVPESVLYDAANDRYLVSNINGQPLDKDNNGFISVVTPEGKILTEKWIAGGQDGVTLNAPKGTGIHKGVLYVADIDVVRMFDAATGKAKGQVEVKDASFLNDLAVGPDGNIYVSDSGLNADFSSNGKDAVWVIAKGKAKPFHASKDLGGPNGLYFQGKKLWVNTFGAPHVARVDAKKGKVDITTIPNGGLDGLYIAKDGTVWVSSWGAKAIYKGKLGGAFEPVFQGLDGPADFGVDTKRNRLLVPRFTQGSVDIFEMK